MDSARCADMDPAIFHELAWTGNKRVTTGGYERAVGVCHHCPVRPACLDYALSLPEVDGVFAGYDPNQIRRMKRAKEELREST